MGDLRPDGTGVPPEDGGSHREELPSFPSEWGPVIIPDDASELAEEAQALRRELRRHVRQTALRSALGLRTAPAARSGSGRGRDSSALGVPVVIIAVAVLTTLVSLFVVTLGQQTDDTPPTASPTAAAPAPVTTGASATALVNTWLTDGNGQQVRLGSLLPAVLLLVDRCDCAGLVPQLAAAAPPGVTIVPVAQAATPTDAPNIHALADPNGLLRAMLTDQAAAIPTAAAAILLDRAGTVVATKPAVLTATELTEDVAKLASGPA
jgi:hypothetical protein